MTMFCSLTKLFSPTMLTCYWSFAFLLAHHPLAPFRLPLPVPRLAHMLFDMTATNLFGRLSIAIAECQGRTGGLQRGGEALFAQGTYCSISGKRRCFQPQRQASQQETTRSFFRSIGASFERVTWACSLRLVGEQLQPWRCSIKLASSASPIG